MLVILIFYNLLTIKLSSKNSIKLKDVANKLGYSLSYISAIFKKKGVEVYVRKSKMVQ